MSRRSLDPLDRQMPAARLTANLTTLSTFEALIATSVVCVGIWALIGLAILGTR